MSTTIVPAGPAMQLGSIQVYWPEGNSLMPKRLYEPHAGIPEYNTAVLVERADTYYALKDTRYVEKRIDELGTEAG